MTASKYVSEDTLEYAEDEFKRDRKAELGEQEGELTDHDRAALLEWCERAETAAESVGYRMVGVLSISGFYNDHALYVRRTLHGDSRPRQS